MKDLISAVILVVICLGFWAAIPVFALIAGTGSAILFLKYIIRESKINDNKSS